MTHALRLVDPLGQRPTPASSDFATVGAYLRAMREHSGVTLADLSSRTRIRKAYLSALEDGDLSSLPSRPFATGYVRAYAQAVGLDGDLAAARFKAESPDTSEPFRSPVGVQHEQVKRHPAIFVALGVVVVAVVAWNISQRAVTMAPRGVAAASAPAPVAAATPAPTGPISLGMSQPAPADQTTPAPYITPGLEPEGSVPAAAPVANRVIIPPAAPTPGGPLPVFAPKGAIYGVPAGFATVILQAYKPGSLIVRGADGAVYFARQLAAGEAYRAPLGRGLVVEAMDPSAGRERGAPTVFQLYVDGQLKGSLAANPISLDKTVPMPAPPAPVAPPTAAAPAPTVQRPTISAPAVSAPTGQLQAPKPTAPQAKAPAALTAPAKAGAVQPLAAQPAKTLAPTAKAALIQPVVAKPAQVQPPKVQPKAQTPKPAAPEVQAPAAEAAPVTPAPAAAQAG
ncbi:MAG: helix-turn-helix domain-containing protein [Caulobacteraceae bacterium]